MKRITGYKIIIRWDDDTEEELSNYGTVPYFKNVDHYLDTIEEERNSDD